MTRTLLPLLAAGLLWLPAPARGEVVGYTTKAAGRDTVLTSVVISSRDRTVAYDASRLIGSAVSYFNSPHDRVILFTRDALPPPWDQRKRLLGDLNLNTGIINPGGQQAALTVSPDLDGTDASAGMAVVFDRPVVNLPGDDVVVFEIQRGDTTALGDAFHVGPVQLRPGLRFITVHGFDLTFDHPRTLPVTPYTPYLLSRPARCLDDLLHLPLKQASSPGGFKALAVGIDLTEMGYPPGAAVTKLFIQDAGSTGVRVDPVLIAGLPEPTPPNVLQQLPVLAEIQQGQLLEKALAGPLASVDEIVFAERVPGNDHWYANFGHYWCGREEYPSQRLPEDWKPDPIFRPGGRLCAYHLRTQQLRVLLDDPAGGVRDPIVHYDGHTILFSYRRGRQPYYHLYEIQADGTGLRQLTDGLCDDIEPAYVPDGGIIFCSSRCNRYVNCWRTPVATLYRCDRDGANVQTVSTNIEHDNTPCILPDGRVLYMRWEYVDRSQLGFHHLWTVNPDGTEQMVYYGNQHAGIAMLDAKPIPDTGRIVASFSPGHGRPEHMGTVTIVDPRQGPDRRSSAVTISLPGKYYRDPYPLSEDWFLVANAEGILLMDRQGRTERLLRGSSARTGLQCHEPRLLCARPRERAIATRVDASQSTGRLFLSDIYHGRNMDGIECGEIKKLLVLEQLPKPVNFSGGPWPLSIGGTFSLARILGTVPVEPDGSAAFEVPAMKSVFFVALDDQDLAVKRMQSFVTLQPGETTGCVGCHEHRTFTPRLPSDALALRRSLRRIEPIADVPDVLDFPRDIQPILDRHCVACHNPDRYEGRVDLTGDHTPLFAQSYWTIVQRGLISDGRNESYGNRIPRTIGSSASRLMQLIDGSHYEVRLSELERKTVRLWIDTSATYPGTYAALGSGMHPVDFPQEVIQRRCGSCHGEPPPEKNRIGQGQYFAFGKPGPALPLVHAFADLKRLRGAVGYFKFGRCRTPQSLCNLTRPDKSLLLRAPLARDADGLGLCGVAVFAQVDDPDYLAILDTIMSAGQCHQQEKRFDMPGFRPNDHYILQMQRFGILPDGCDTQGKIDAYATDRLYWQSVQ